VMGLCFVSSRETQVLLFHMFTIIWIRYLWASHCAQRRALLKPSFVVLRFSNGQNFEFESENMPFHFLHCSKSQISVQG
jgi:hypothetical protein